MTDPKTLELLKRYKERGFRLIFYPAKTKIPSAGWNAKDPPKVEYQEEQNVGVVLGNEIEPGRFLADIDFDWIPGIELSSYILPRTGFFFGHLPSKPLSHAFYTMPEQPVYRKITNITYAINDHEYHLAESSQCFVEIRGGLTTEGLFGQQTMVPPSVWSNGSRSSEMLSFYGKSSIDSEITFIDNLPRRIILYSIACLLYANIPRGLFKHEMRLACAGFLLTNGMTQEETAAVMKAVVEQNGPHDKGDELSAINTTVTAIHRKQKYTGRPVLIELIDKCGGEFRYGRILINEIVRLLGGSEFIESKGKPIPNQENIRRSFELRDIKLSYNEFSNKILVVYPSDNFKGEIEEPIRTRIRLETERKYGFLPLKEFCNDVMDDISWENRFHPVINYLKPLKWDGVPRIDTWLIQSAKADDTPYVKAVSSIMLMAAVKRITDPGCKYDEMVVLESGKQGLMKSSALRTLCPKDEWFSDNLPLNLKAQEVIELTGGKWIIEVSELNKIKTTQMEHVKGLLSRQDDTARLAYRHDAKTQRRQCIFIGTTNSYTYLTDQTGNRRFWPIRVQKFDIEWIRLNRDQIWAEAYARAESGESIRLPEELYKPAEKEQENRLVDDTWRDVLNLYFEKQYQRVAYDEIWEALGVTQVEKQTPQLSQRIAEVMQSLGFTKASQVRDRNQKGARGWKRDRICTNEEWNEMREVKPENEADEEGQQMMNFKTVMCGSLVSKEDM